MSAPGQGIKGRAYFEELLSMPQPQLTHTGTWPAEFVFCSRLGRGMPNLGAGARNGNSLI